MKIKTTIIIVILVGLSMMSCRENEELTNMQENKALKSSRIGLDSLTIKDSVFYSTNPPKDPPVKGDNWRTEN